MSRLDAQDTKPSSHLTIDLASNNPFRNRAASPASAGATPSPQSPAFSFDNSKVERPRSRNPFLEDPSTMATLETRPQTSPKRPPPHIQDPAPPKQGGLISNYDTLFQNLALDSKPTNNDTTTNIVPPPVNRPMNYENHPPLRKAGPPPMNGHHSSRSREEEQRRRLAGPATGLRAAQPLDIFADPPDMGRSGRPRRNSESSVADRKRILSPEEEKRRHERRRRDREAKHGPDGKLKPPSKKPNKQLDVIDKLDVSSIYGTGLFHHDGPFDACRPHRNRKGSNRAPMQAFPKDSINNTLGGAGPVNSNLDLAQFHGRGVEGFTDFSTSGKRNPAVDTNSFEPYAGAGAPNRPRPHGDRPGIDRTSSFNPGARVDPVHGDESLGLGTSTFLDGAPAPRNVIQRRESEGEQNNAGGLGRKKSLVQKIRGMNRERPSRRPMSPSSPGKSGSMRNSTPTSPLRGDDNPAVLSAGGMARVKEEGQSINPFFTTTTSPATANPSVTDYDDAYEQKGMRIKIAETEKLHRAREIEHARASDSAQAMRGITAGASGGHMESGTIATTGDKKMAAPSLERRVTTDVVSGPASGGLEKEEKPFGGGGFLSRVKSLKGGKRARPDRTLG